MSLLWALIACRSNIAIFSAVVLTVDPKKSGKARAYLCQPATRPTTTTSLNPVWHDPGYSWSRGLCVTSFEQHVPWYVWIHDIIGNLETQLHIWLLLDNAGELDSRLASKTYLACPWGSGFKVAHHCETERHLPPGSFCPDADFCLLIG